MKHDGRCYPVQRRKDVAGQCDGASLQYLCRVYSSLISSQHISCPLIQKPHSPPQTEGGDDAPPGGLTDADIDTNWDEAIESFDGMELPEELLRGIYAYGFEKPSAIQQRAIKPTILGRDLIAQAQSGTVRVFVQTVCLACFRSWRDACRSMVLFWHEMLAHEEERIRGRRNEDHNKHHLSSLKRVTLDVSDKQLDLEIGPSRPSPSGCWPFLCHKGYVGLISDYGQ